MDRTKQLAKIKELFTKLYAFSSEEIAEFMLNLEKFPDQGLKELKKILIEGQNSQKEFLIKLNQINPNFYSDFSHFIQNKSIQIKNSYEQEEQNSAEIILQKFNDK